MKKKLTGLFIIMMMFTFIFGAGRIISYASGASESAADSSASSTVKNGLIKKSNGYLYYYVNGVRKTGWQTIDGNRYYFSKKTGKFPKGAAKTGLVKIGKYRYYFDDSGIMQTGWQTIKGYTYYFKKKGSGALNGSAASGLIKIGSYRYYFNTSTNRMYTGWKTIKGYRYYFRKKATGKKHGAAATGLIKIGNYKYYFTTTGKMKKSAWKTIDGSRYYFNSKGRMVTGWKTIGSYTYYFDSKGVLQTDGYVGSESAGYAYVDSNGRKITTDKENMVSKAQSYSSSTNYLILVNSKTNKVGVFTGKKGSWKLKKYMTCATGKASTPTVKGEYTVQAKGKSFGTSSYTCWYYTQFYGDYLFHSVLYSPGSQSEIVESGLGTNASHGCVRLSLSNAKWIYDNIPTATKVVSY